MATTGDYLQLLHWASSANPLLVEVSKQFPKKKEHSVPGGSVLNKSIFLNSQCLAGAGSGGATVCQHYNGLQGAALLSCLMDTINPGQAEGTQGCLVWLSLDGTCPSALAALKWWCTFGECASFPHWTWIPPSTWNAPFACLSQKYKQTNQPTKPQMEDTLSLTWMSDASLEKNGEPGESTT